MIGLFLFFSNNLHRLLRFNYDPINLFSLADFCFSLRSYLILVAELSLVILVAELSLVMNLILVPELSPTMNLGLVPQSIAFPNSASLV